MMDPRRLLTFRAVAHERSFSRAARELALTQPAVSQQVAALEKELGTRLLDRRPGGLQLTRAGDVLLQHADSIADRLALADAQLAGMASDERARLRIGGFPTSLAGLVPAAIARMRSSDVKVAVEEGSAEQLAARVRRGELDLAVAFQDAAEPRVEHDGLERRELMREDFRVALAPGHPLAGRSRVRIADLAGEGWTVAVPDGLIVRACRAAGFEPHIVSIASDQLVVRALVERGLAVTLVPGLLVDAFDGIAMRAIAGGGPQRDVYVLLAPGGRHPLATEAMGALAATVEELGTRA